jgi:GT2 family glycosyltransferase
MSARKDYIAFDQYQRYQTFAQLIDFHRNDDPTRKFQVLELGANEHKALKLFLDKDNILFTDITLTESMQADPEFQMADGTALTFADGSFDFVVAADVLEHVPIEKREQFLAEAYRVARIGVIACFPFRSQDTADAEERVNTYYRTIAGEDYIWLKEHSENALPDLEELDAFLGRAKYPYFKQFHGDIQTWEKMWYCHFNTVFMPETIDFRIGIDHFYNSALYQNDISDSCYRVFYVLSHECVDDWAAFARKMWKPGANEKRGYLDTLMNAHQELHLLHEQGRLQKLVAEKDHHIEKQNTLLEETMQKYRKLEDVYRQLDDVYRRETAGLQQQLDQAHEANAVEQERVMRAETVCKDLQKTVSGLNSEKATIEKALAEYKEHYLLAISQRNDLQNQLALANANYQAISNAFFWKLTKPLRVVSSGIKKMVRSNRYTRLIGKGIRSLLTNGLSNTWQRVKLKLKTRRRPAQPVYTREQLEKIPENIKFSVLVPLYNTPEKYLREMIQSVIDQTYTNWELCLADGSNPEHDYVEKVCCEYAQKDPRIIYHRLEENKGISENTNACAKLATGDYIALLDHDDLYEPDALYWNAKAIYETDADVLYSDEDHLALNGERVNPFYKPDWSPDLLYSQMYICHLLVFRRSLFEQIGGYRSEFDGSQDYDLMLRFSEQTQKICHIPRILYAWRESENSTAANADAKPYAHIAGKNALDSHLKRKYGENAYAEETEYTFVFNPRFRLEHNPLISIIIPMKDHWEMSDACVKSIFEKSTYRNFEIIILDNRSEKDDTFRWFEEVQKNSQVRVIEANMEFNWSKLNNFGVTHAKGDVFVFLNNDTLVISEDWLERLAENSLRPDVGVVGGLLLYEDNTIQHAGVIVGMGGWADHLFKGMALIHYGSPYVSPMVSRNVMAVTGACLAVSRKTLEKIGLFDEEFIICGSDIELGIRAHEMGLLNRYDVNVRLYHLESKSRDSYIPEVDFQKSYAAYGPYRENIDPYFNVNLDTNSTTPKERVAPMNLVNFKNFLKRCPLTARMYEAAKTALMAPQGYEIPEIGPLNPRECKLAGDKIRLNIITPSVDKKHVFGGIATALKFYYEVCEKGGFDGRVIVVDAPVFPESSVLSPEYQLVKPEEHADIPYQVVPMGDRYGKTFPVAKNDIFIATGWWTAYTISEVIRWQKATYGSAHPLVYMIQDYEPGFYPWSSRYMMADSTYRSDIPVYAVMNSQLLRDFFDSKGYQFAKTWSFDPKLNDSLVKFLPAQGTAVSKKKQILVYGRPSTARNAFEVLIYGLKAWAAQQEDIAEWTILSAGEQHDDVDLGNGAVLHSVGKLSLQDYAQMMLDTYAGVSLMVSPHPSYPPLEMASFGVKTITNCYDSKDLTAFSNNIISLRSCAPRDIAAELTSICNAYAGSGIIQTSEAYLNSEHTFETIPQELADVLRQ